LNEAQPIIDMLMSRYDAKTFNDLKAKLEEEVIPELAEKAGMSPEAFKEHVKIKQENAQLKKQVDKTSVDERVTNWQNQALNMRGTAEKPGKYPDFDIVAAAEHPKYGQKFQKLLEAGIDVEAAYLASHHEQIIGKAQVETAKATGRHRLKLPRQPRAQRWRQ